MIWWWWWHKDSYCYTTTHCTSRLTLDKLHTAPSETKCSGCEYVSVSLCMAESMSLSVCVCLGVDRSVSCAAPWWHHHGRLQHGRRWLCVVLRWISPTFPVNYPAPRRQSTDDTATRRLPQWTGKSTDAASQPATCLKVGCTYRRPLTSTVRASLVGNPRGLPFPRKKFKLNSLLEEMQFPAVLRDLLALFSLFLVDLLSCS